MKPLADELHGDEKKGESDVTPISTLYLQSSKQPGAVAFSAGDDAWSYRRLSTEVERLARGLLERGVGEGDRVALHMSNLPELAVAYYACFRVGAIACPLNIRLKAAELRPLLEHLRPALYLGQAELYHEIAPIQPDVLAPDVRFLVGCTNEKDGAQRWSELLVGLEEQSILHDPNVDAPAVLLTTSGTTGQPKFVAHSLRTLAAIAESFIHLGFNEEHIAVNAVPMVHVGGLATFLGGVRFGVPMILFERFDPDAVLDAIEPHRCSWLIGVPMMYAALLEGQRKRPRQVDSMRFCLVAGDVCPLQLQLSFDSMFNAPLRSFWGSTETFGTFTYGLEPGPVSRPAPGTEFRLIDDKKRPVGPEEVGELLVRGPSVSIGYWTGPGQIVSPSDGWFHTGDLMQEGKKSEFWFVSRKKDLIIRGGSNISPIEVERALMEHPAVCEAAVLGIPDVDLGQRVAGFITLAENFAKSDIDNILADMSTRLADYKVPEWLKVVDEIPRNALGKIDRMSLLAMSRDRRVRRDT